MKKYFLFCVGLLIAVPVFAQNIPYVRKTLEPEFFIPENDKFNRQEKLPPVYFNGVEVTKNQAEKIIKFEVPEYKDEYNKYHHDLENMVKTGVLEKNDELEDALIEMQKDEVFEVKKTPSQNSEIKQKFEKVLEESLD